MIETTAELLQQLGFEPDSARVFASLAALGPSPASAIAKAARLSRPQTYRALEGLTSNGIVHSDLTRPRRYSAVDAEQLLSWLHRQIDNQNRQLALLETTVRAAMSKAQPGPPTHRTDILRGREALLVHAEQMIRLARARVNIVATHPAVTISFLERVGLWQSLHQAVARGVEVRLLLRRSDQNRTERETMARDGPSVRLLETERALSSQTVDGARALVVLVSDPSASLRATQSYSLVADTPDLVALLDRGFDAQWELTR